MRLALEKMLAPATAAEPPDWRLNISVVFTSVEATMAALRRAAEMATQLGARITIVVPQVVPLPLPLSSPPVLLDFSERRFHTIASESPVETSVRLYLCRDARETLGNVLAPRSLIVVGSRKRWWPTHEKRLARWLRKRGHEVVVTE